MSRRRILWFPLRGIDKTRPKKGESVNALERMDNVDYAYDGSNMCVYNSKDMVTRRPLKQYLSTDFGTVYGLHKYSRGLAIAAADGIYLDGTSIKSTTFTDYVSMAGWYQSLYWSDGTSWGYIDSDDTSHIIGIPPYEYGWSSSSVFSTSYTTGGTWSNVSWDATTRKLTRTVTGVFTSDMVDEYIQVFSVDDDRCFTGRISAVEADGSGCTIDVHDDDEPSIPDSFTNETLAVYVSPVLWSSYYQYKLVGKPKLMYKYRFYRSSDGARSNTHTWHQRAADWSWPDNLHYITAVLEVNQLVGKVRLSGWPTSHPTDTEVDKIEIFRLDVNVETSDLYRLVKTIDITDGYTYDDTNTSTELETLDDDNKYPCPYALRSLLFHANRLWGVYQNRVYYSEPYGYEERFQYFGATGLNYFEFPDTVKRIETDQRSILVFMDRSTWILEGLNPEAMVKRSLNEDIGTFSETSVGRFGGSIYTVSSDYKFYQIAGSEWAEVPEISAAIDQDDPSYIHLLGSDTCVWIADGTKLIRYNTTNRDLWIYNISGRLAAGSHTTYIGVDGTVYELDREDGTESFTGAYIESPDIYIGDTNGHRGTFSRLLFRCQCDLGRATIWLDGEQWKTIDFVAGSEQNVLLHFYPAKGYYARVKIEALYGKTLRLTGPIILNPW